MTLKLQGGGTVQLEGEAVNRELAGVVAVYANLDGTGTIAGRASLNISSYDDDGTGLYGFNLTASFSDGNRTTTINVNYDQGGGWARGGCEISTPIAGAVDVEVGYWPTPSPQDQENVYVTAFGDLA